MSTAFDQSTADNYLFDALASKLADAIIGLENAGAKTTTASVNVAEETPGNPDDALDSEELTPGGDDDTAQDTTERISALSEDDLQWLRSLRDRREIERRARLEDGNGVLYFDSSDSRALVSNVGVGPFSRVTANMIGIDAPGVWSLGTVNTTQLFLGDDGQIAITMNNAGAEKVQIGNPLAGGAGPALLPFAVNAASVFTGTTGFTGGVTVDTLTVTGPGPGSALVVNNNASIGNNLLVGNDIEANTIGSISAVNLITARQAVLVSGTNQLALGGGNQTIISAPMPALGTWIATIPDAGGNSNFVLDTSGKLVITNAAAANQVLGGLSATTAAFTATPTVTSATLNNATNQLTLGAGNTTTISSTAPAASRTVTLPDAGANSNFVLDTSGALTILSAAASNQILSGTSATTAVFTATPTVTSATLNNATNQLILGSGTTTTLTSPAPASSRVVTLLDAGANSTITVSTAVTAISALALTAVATTYATLNIVLNHKYQFRAICTFQASTANTVLQLSNGAGGTMNAAALWAYNSATTIQNAAAPGPVALASTTYPTTTYVEAYFVAGSTGTIVLQASSSTSTNTFLVGAPALVDLGT